MLLNLAQQSRFMLEVSIGNDDDVRHAILVTKQEVRSERPVTENMLFVNNYR